MASSARAQRLIDEFTEAAALDNGGFSVRHGIAAVLRHLCATEAQYADMESFYAVPVHILDGLADSLEAPTLLERAMAGDAAAARQFLFEGGFTDAEGNLLPHLQ